MRGFWRLAARARLPFRTPKSATANSGVALITRRVGPTASFLRHNHNGNAFSSSASPFPSSSGSSPFFGFAGLFLSSSFIFTYDYEALLSVCLDSNGVWNRAKEEHVHPNAAHPQSFVSDVLSWKARHGSWKRRLPQRPFCHEFTSRKITFWN